MKFKNNIQYLKILLLFLGISISTNVTGSTSPLPQQPVRGAKNFLVIRTNFSTGNVDAKTTRADIDTYMTAVNDYLLKTSNNRASVGTVTVTPIFQSSITADQITPGNPGAFNEIIAEMRRLAQADGYDTSGLIYYIFDADKNIDIGGGALGTGNGISGSVLWPANQAFFPPGFVHETLHMLGAGHAELLSIPSLTNFQKLHGGWDPFNFMGTEGGLTQWATGSRTGTINGTIPLIMKRKFDWVTDQNLPEINIKEQQIHRIYLSDTDQDGYPLDRKLGVLLNAFSPNIRFSVSYYKNTSAHTRIQNDGVLVHAVFDNESTGLVIPRLIDLKPNSVDGNPEIQEPANRKQIFDYIYDYADNALVAGEEATVANLFTLKVVAEGGIGKDRWADIEIIPSADIPFNKVVSIKREGIAFGPQYVRVNTTTSEASISGFNTTNDDTRFLVEAHPNGGVALKSLLNNKYLQVNNLSTTVPIAAKGGAPGAWEGFNWTAKGGNKIVLQSSHSNKWVFTNLGLSGASLEPNADTEDTAQLFSWEEVVDTTPPNPSAQTPYNGIVATIPGVVEAENYDVASATDASYNDNDIANRGGQYRTTEGVDVETCGDTGGGFNIGYTKTGEWMEYTVNVTAAGTYRADIRHAANGNGGTISIESNGVNKTGDIIVGTTGGWQTYVTTPSGEFTLSAGQQILRINIVKGGMNLNKITFVAATGSTEPTTPDIPFGQNIGITPVGTNSSSGTPFKFVSARFNAGGTLISREDAIGEWEKFVVEDAGNGNVRIKVKNFGSGYRYLQAMGTAIAATSISGTETNAQFEWITVDTVNNTFRLKSVATGFYLEAPHTDVNPTIMTSRAILDDWGIFKYTVEGLTKTIGGTAAKGIDTTKDLNAIIYPNPLNGNDTLTIHLNSEYSNNVTVELFNTVGQSILTESYKGANGTITMDATKLKSAKGLYLLKITLGTKTQILKGVF